MLIGQICKQAGVTKDRVRHYESLGLLTSTDRQAGTRVYRDYGDDTLQRLDLIQQGKALGFRLAEMKPWLDLYMTDQLSSHAHKTLLVAKIADVEDRIKALQKMKRDLVGKLRAAAGE